MAAAETRKERMMRMMAANQAAVVQGKLQGLVVQASAIAVASSQYTSEWKELPRAARELMKTKFTCGTINLSKTWSQLDASVKDSIFKELRDRKVTLGTAHSAHT
mmetsp:Transcript_58298/g.126731  ORF Transcript_58298/g.126731 Transcript_58298/m.126731 type:complete len:105 (-) Transcript_58298:64-378(-)|eukprot:CAMPEP_0175812266 /NCGR_PEP_ID=MMETSP0107_2-20121207/4282_1 /TAXON_ID=195067 ORGANISM="Goniomonas pacifica, Strain CCMP1869" /NCGR_SAMPLE_ID=MMETSP0107_2 /ASSEMBLY_ACC=CAM_ASM_000203 /LENGTH=104 /DNA_ID=CAMNT_0017124111 /DNA_START=511 /DNA_END=825 /DNA_ORIENTATION=+